MPLFPASAGGEEPVARPHRDRSVGARSVSLHGQTFVDEGLVGIGRLAAGTVDFPGDALGSGRLRRGLRHDNRIWVYRVRLPAPLR